MTGEGPSAEASDPSADPAKVEPEAEATAAPDAKPIVSPESPAADPTKPEWERVVERAGKRLVLFDFAAVPTTKAGWIVRLGATAVALFYLWRHVLVATHLLTSAHPPSPIPTEEIADYRFRLPERTRKEIFEDLATAELSERARAAAANTWNGHLWSREDDRGHYERVAARQAAAKYKVSLSQIYLVLDEGIREHWLAPNGEPLPATTPPFNARTTW